MSNTIDIRGDNAVTDSIIDKSITEMIDDVVTSIGQYAFYGCTALTTANFPVATTIGNSAFYNCSSLTTANFPVATTIGGSAFYNCSSLTTANFPVATSIKSYTFHNCKALTTADFPAVTSIGGFGFDGCSNLTTLILRNTQRVVTLYHTNAFINALQCIIYVPDSLVNDYKEATNWSEYADRIKGLSELPETE